VSSFQFLPTTDSFSLINALQLARSAQLVYSAGEEVEQEVIRDWGFRDFDFFDVRGTQGMIAANRDIVLVSFRGTEQDAYSDWMTDLNAELVPGPMKGYVHGGFYDALSQVWMHIDKAVKRFDRRQSKSLWVTGHSLGASLATLAVARWLERGREVSGLYTFGQPRTGDSDFARNFNFDFKSKAFRFVNNKDLVTRIPPRAFGYSHLGTFKYFTESGVLEDSIGWWNEFLDSWSFRSEDYFLSFNVGIEDHSMDMYHQLISQVAKTTRTSLTLHQNLDAFIYRSIQHLKNTVTVRRRAA
jgi:triacylglycerol lipase